MKRAWCAPCHGVTGVWHTLELDLISCFVHRVKEKVAGCWVWPTRPEQSLPEQEFLECSLYQMLWETACVGLPYVLPKKAIWRGCGNTGLGERINSSISSLPWAPSQESRGLYCGLSGALLASSRNVQCLQQSPRHFSVMAWVVGKGEPGHRGWGGRIHQAGLFLHHFLLRCPLLKISFTLRKVPVTIIEFKDPVV